MQKSSLNLANVLFWNVMSLYKVEDLATLPVEVEV